MSLAQYRKRFSRLRTYKDRKKWSAITAFQAPHKPFLLLSIMDLIVQGSITENFIEPGFELVETFNGYWNSIMPLGSKTSMAYPFPRLKTDGFWPEQDNLHWHRKNLFRRWWKRVSYSKLLTFELCFTGILGLTSTFLGRCFNININSVNILQMPKPLCYARLSYAILSFMLAAKPTKGFVMIGNWRYIVSAILFLISGSLFLFINSYWGLSLAYIVSLPIFAIGVIIVWRSKRKPPSS